VVAVFRAGVMGEIARAHPEEARYKCDACKWVHVFHPIATGWRTVVLK
jgi:hypothetical protein